MFEAVIFVQLGLAIIAVVEGMRKATGGALRGSVTIVVAALLGLLAGVAGTYWHYPLYTGIDPLTGLMIGLAASGGVTLAQKFTNPAA